MFWRVSGFTQPSPVEAALDKANCTLEDLLAEDDLIQEVKSLNIRVLDFLQKPEAVSGLVRHLVSPPPPDASEQQQLRLPFAACEVLCCEVDLILTQLLRDESSMDLLFSLLQKTPPLECVTAGYFARVVGMLLFRRTGDVMKFLQGRRHLLGRLVAHLDTASIFEILVRLVGAEEQTGMYLPPSQVQWLTGTDLMPQLLSVLGPGHPTDASQHAAEVLAAVARSQLSPLGRAMAEPSFLETLLQRAFEADSPTSVQALDVCIALLEPRGFDAQSPGSPPGGSPRGPGLVTASSGEFRRISAETAKGLQRAAVDGIASHAARLHAMLADTAAPPEQETSFGVLAPPLGSGRLKAVEMVAALARLGVPPAEQALVDAELLPRCMALLLQYPFNNQLHHQVTAALMGAIEAGSQELIRHVFDGGALLAWLTGAPSEVRARPRPGDARADERPALRAGYTGHITFIANKLVDAAERSLFVSQQLDGSAAWREFSEGPLQSRNALENVNKWACGRPEPSELTAAQAAADEAGLMDLDPDPAGGLELPNDSEGGSPTPDGAARRYFDATGEEEDDPVFRDASDALDALRLNPHVGTRGTAIQISGAAGSSDSSDDSSDGSPGRDGGGGSPPPAPRGSGASAADALSRSLDEEAGVLVGGDEEELLLEDDAVVVGLPVGSPSATGAPAALLPPPSAAEAKLPHIDGELPEGLDPRKPVSAAVPPAIPLSGGDAEAPKTSAPMSVPARPAPASDAEDAGGADSGADGPPVPGSAPRSGRSSMASAAAWLRGSGGKSGGKSAPPGPRSGVVIESSPTSDSGQRAPRSAFASWRPAWQAVEDQAAAAAASAAQEYIASARSDSGDSPPRKAQAAVDGRSETAEPAEGPDAAAGGSGSSASIAEAAKRFGGGAGSGSQSGSNAAGASASSEAETAASGAGERVAAHADSALPGAAAGTSASGGSDTSGGGGADAAAQPSSGAAVRPGSRPRFNFGGLRGAVDQKHKDGLSRHFKEDEDVENIREAVIEGGEEAGAGGSGEAAAAAAPPPAAGGTSSLPPGVRLELGQGGPKPSSSLWFQST